MIVQQSGNTILTRWYSGSSYIKETSSGVTKEYTFIGGEAYTAPVVAIKQSGSTTWYYLLRFYPGNTTHVVYTSDRTVDEYSYDAWGRMRNPATWDNFTHGSEPVLFSITDICIHQIKEYKHAITKLMQIKEIILYLMETEQEQKQ